MKAHFNRSKDRISCPIVERKELQSEEMVIIMAMRKKSSSYVSERVRKIAEKY